MHHPNIWYCSVYFLNLIHVKTACGHGGHRQLSTWLEQWPVAFLAILGVPILWVREVRIGSVPSHLVSNMDHYVLRGGDYYDRWSGRLVEYW